MRDAQDVSNSCVQYESLSPDKRLARLSEEYRGGLTILEGILCLALWRGSGNLRVIRRVAFGGEEVLDESISLPRDLELSLSGQEVLLLSSLESVALDPPPPTPTNVLALYALLFIDERCGSSRRPLMFLLGR